MSKPFDMELFLAGVLIGSHATRQRHVRQAKTIQVAIAERWQRENPWTSRADDFLKNAQVAFVRSNEAAATSRRHLLRKLKRATNMVVHRNPAMCLCTGAAAFGAVLNVDLG
ncbi:hypothetical protein [Pseudomonas sp. Marseille-Q5115]|uniref:hypothetical protein n=1 Tax=Pseudomonas sp. Marseille-Q5115 TaxID=2866593 RepID=UPI001CE419F8|nr:hypothetical protein [Pseudomonas sp. Marseille-Q5115]